MAGFLSNEINYSIFKRHIKRKLTEYNEIKYQDKKPVLLFDQICSPKNSSNNNVILATPNNFAVDNTRPVVGIEKENCGQTQTFVMKKDFSLFNQSPPMDLDESFDSLQEGIEMDNDEQFKNYFMELVSQKSEIIRLVDRCMEADCLSVEMSTNQIIIISRNVHGQWLELASRHSWLLIYLLCKCSSLIIITFSSKLLIRTLLDSCSLDLHMSDVQLNSVVAFFCDHPIIDLQIGFSFLQPDKCLENIEQLKMLSRQWASESGSSTHHRATDLFDIYDILHQRIASSNSLDAYVYISCPTNAVLCGLEYFGMAVDMEQLGRLKIQISQGLRTLEQKAIEAGGSVLCLKSPSHLRQLIFSNLKLHEKFTEKYQTEHGVSRLFKNRSTNETVLSILSSVHPFPELVTKYRHINKTKAIYVDSFQSFIKANRGIICGCWDQTSSVTGRIYCSKPNLQALPRHVDRSTLPGIAIDVKSIFVSSHNHTYVSADFSQIELRIYAHLANDTRLIDLFHKTDDHNEDLFLNFAKIISSMKDNSRQVIKRVLYACLYGIGSKCLARMLSTSINQAKSMLMNVKKYLSSLEIFASSCIEHIYRKKYVCTIVGRKRYFQCDTNDEPSHKSEIKRQAMSYAIQGSAADICKVAMVNCQRRISYRYIDAKLILTRHDELVWRVHNDGLIEMLDIIDKMMNIDTLQFKVNNRLEIVELSVPMRIKLKKGVNLTELEDIELLRE